MKEKGGDTNVLVLKFEIDRIGKDLSGVGWLSLLFGAVKYY